MGRSAVITDTDDKRSATHDADAHAACSDPVAAVAAQLDIAEPEVASAVAEPEVASAVEITTVGSRVYTASADCIPDGFVLASKTGVAVASGPMKGWFLLKKQR